MGCSCTRENALKVVTSNKLQQDRSDVMAINNSVSYNFGTTKNPSSNHHYGNNVSLSRIDKMNKDYFTIIISFSKENRKQLMINLENNQEYMTITQLLNKALFESVEYDCNFTSRYCDEIEDYEYLIERINEYEAVGNYNFNYIYEKLVNKNYGENAFDCRFNSEEDTPIRSDDKFVKGNINKDYEDKKINNNIENSYRCQVWNMYINNILEDFSMACRENRVVYKEEVIELRYEKI